VKAGLASADPDSTSGAQVSRAPAELPGALPKRAKHARSEAPGPCRSRWPAVGGSRQQRRQRGWVGPGEPPWRTRARRRGASPRPLRLSPQHLPTPSASSWWAWPWPRGCAWSRPWGSNGRLLPRPRGWVRTPPCGIRSDPRSSRNAGVRRSPSKPARPGSSSRTKRGTTTTRPRAHVVAHLPKEGRESVRSTVRRRLREPLSSAAGALRSSRGQPCVTRDTGLARRPVFRSVQWAVECTRTPSAFHCP
jgi:hypothetical protein